MKKALFYSKIKGNIVRCELCPHFCVLKEDDTGKCRVRKNIEGVLYSLSYEKPVAIHLDPIEKKPLYHFLPGTKSFSIGMAGCNLRCKHCQNWEMSQSSPEEIPTPNIKVEDIVKEALKFKCPSISYTYSEPLVSYEYVLDIAKLAKKSKIKNTIVSNGFINPKPLEQLCDYLDGANIDVKSINEEFYKKICDARLNPILNVLKIMQKRKVWIELTNLIIPTLNDKPNEIKKLVSWVKENLGVNVPLHFTAFYPCYKLMNLPSTPLDILRKARDIAKKEGINYVYTGNLPDEEGSTTFCPKCNEALIKRSGFYVIQNKLKNGKCNCGEKIAGVWK